MGGRKRMSVAVQLTTAVIGFLCAVVLAALFYGAMAYQMADGGETGAQGMPAATPAPLVQGASAAQMFPGPLLALSDGTLEQEVVQDIDVGGTVCRVVTRSYVMESGESAEAVSAYPADYLRVMAQEGYTPQLITGFLVAGLEAVYEIRGEDALLAARDGEYVYMIGSAAQEQAIYALGAGAALEP